MATREMLPTISELRTFVQAMRELGVISAFGITLGPVPRDPNYTPPRRSLEEQVSEDAKGIARKLYALGIRNPSAEMVAALKGHL